MSVKYNFPAGIEATFTGKNYEKNLLIRFNQSRQRLAVCQPVHVIDRCQIMGM
jgi:hypothetical protein